MKRRSESERACQCRRTATIWPLAVAVMLVVSAIGRRVTSAEEPPSETRPQPVQPPAPHSTPAEAGTPPTAGTPAGTPTETATPTPARVILLTGYEPFGGATVNPSWEAVKGYDGKMWHGYKLVARRLPVIWGAPMPALKKLMTDLQPVAVFSFGLGKPDGFYMESLARNARAPHLDNDGKKPAETKIAEGPDVYFSAATVKTIQQALVKKGYPIVLSQDAGQYLCEECLYSLEHLRATAFKQTHVQFCHMPAVDNKIGPQKTAVTPEYLVTFVGDVLEAWRATQADQTEGP